jgi:hypothetical protein
MKRPTDPAGKEQRLLRHARREGLLIMAVWLICLIWSTVVGYLLGYRRPVQDMRLILGMPDWVFWAIVLPWALCFVFSIWFCFRYMADDDLGEDRYEDPGHG